MQRVRVQAIIVQNDKLLFGRGNLGKRGFGHYFIGGAVENGETLEDAVIREVYEETNCIGKIVFPLGDIKENHYSFLVEIGEQKVKLGYDPEESLWDFKDRALQELEFVSFEEREKITEIDIQYFKLLFEQCDKNKYIAGWVEKLKKLLIHE